MAPIARSWYEPAASSDATITIDCDTCVMRDTPTCADCVVTFLCDRDPTDALLLDLGELVVLRRLADAGLAPRLRHRARGTVP
jgi:hypothetical protein